MSLPAAWLEREFWRLRNGRSSNPLSRLPRRSRQNCVYRLLLQSVPGRRLPLSLSVCAKAAPAERAAGLFPDHLHPVLANTRVAPAERGAGPFVDCQTPAHATPRGQSFVPERRTTGAPPSPVKTSFSLLDRARPVFSFSADRKRENGGCNGPAIAGRQTVPPARASKIPSL